MFCWLHSTPLRRPAAQNHLFQTHTDTEPYAAFFQTSPIRLPQHARPYAMQRNVFCPPATFPLQPDKRRAGSLWASENWEDALAKYLKEELK